MLRDGHTGLPLRVGTTARGGSWTCAWVRVVGFLCPCLRMRLVGCNHLKYVIVIRNHCMSFTASVRCRERPALDPVQECLDWRDQIRMIQ